MKKESKRINAIPWIHRIITTIITILVTVLIILRVIHKEGGLDFVDILLITVLAGCFADITIFSSVTSFRDGQTGISNDDAMIIFANFLASRKKFSQYTSIFINIKNYQYVNRSVGSRGGDIVLEKYARILVQYLLKNEKCCRLGGDSFLILIKNERVDDFIKYLSPLKVSMNMNGSSYNFSLFGRFGLYPLKNEDDMSAVFENPAIALNVAKNISKDVVWYNQKIAEGIYREKEVSSKFREAIKNHEFKVYYQPKVNILTDTLEGCEALVRWESSGKLLSPDKFVPALENNGLIGELDLYVLEQVCKDLIYWNSKNYKLVRVSSNFSKNNFRNADYPNRILEIIKKYNIDSSFVEIELTESADYDDFVTLLNFLKTMKENNIITTIDDFGVGYSSLELLKNINLDVVKIDKKLIDNIEQDEGENEHAKLVKHILKTCAELNKEVVVEGVESNDQKFLLKKMNCKTIQGYLYDKPLCKEDFEKRLQQPVYE